MKYTKNEFIADLIANAIKGHEVTDGEELYICDKKVFGDDEEHEMNFSYLDGIAISEDGEYIMTYPKRKDLTAEMREEIRDYDGIPAPRAYTPRDIALCYGKIIERKKLK